MDSNISEVKNKIRRRQLFEEKQKAEKKKNKKLRQERKAKGEKSIPHTIETLRVHEDVTEAEQKSYEFNKGKFDQYFANLTTPNIAITSSFRPFTTTHKLCRDLANLIPNAKFYKRKKVSLQFMIKKAVEKGFTDVLFINDDRKEPNSLLLCHLPDGPTVHFKILNYKLSKHFKHRSKRYMDNPEVVISNLTTPLGQTVGAMFAVLFPQTPNFEHRRLFTIHNQRDYIFLRHHRYQFKNGEKVSLNELGPRITLRLQFVQRGLYDPSNKEYDWMLKRHAMEKNRRKFYL